MPDRPGGPSAAPIAPLVRESTDLKSALFDITYGMFVVTSRQADRFNSQACNTVLQITSQPPKVAVGINKQNLTHEFITQSGVMATSILGKGNMGAIKSNKEIRPDFWQDHRQIRRHRCQAEPVGWVPGASGKRIFPGVL